VGRDTTTEDVKEAVRIVAETAIRLQPEGMLNSPHSQKSTKYKLTQYTHGLGCACKLRPQALEKVLTALPTSVNPNVIVGIETADDAAVYRLSNDLAIVQTVDFFTPIVDDPYSFGAISAANSLSDIYAMGAKPLFALNVVGFPSRRLPLYVLEQVLKGAADKANEAGISIIGGHTVDDTEPKFGLAVSGVVHPNKVVRNSTACPGDALILTKPLGVGIISTALKRGLASDEVAKRAVELMAKLNRSASVAMIEVGVNACTDITGFGLLGHLREMATASKVDVTLNLGSIPIISSAWDLAAANMVPGGTLSNLNYVKAHVAFEPEVSGVAQLILADAQTSGGLLISLPPEKAQRILGLMQKRGVGEASMIGTVKRKGKGHIRVKA
jgi:selenium donor protein